MVIHRIPRDRKEQILRRIKDDGISVSQTAQEHGVAEGTIYNWLSKGVTGQPTLRELAKLRKENKQLLELVGAITIKLSQSQKKELAMRAENKSVAARELGIARSSLYYRPKQPRKDWDLQCRIEAALRGHPSYGHKRLAIHLGVNKKRTLRVMKLYGIQPYRRRGKKWRKPPEKYVYNTSRIHSALKMPPQTYALHYQVSGFLLETVSD